ncbi:helix-turn-helix transcriptional regulator [Lachnospiraceae bacterium 45-W7]
MVRLRILEILEEQNHTKYWLFKQMDLSYQNFNRMVMNETRSIRFENLDILSNILNCPVGDLFEKTENSDEMISLEKN